MTRISGSTHLSSMFILALSALLWVPAADGQRPLDAEREAAAVEFLSNGIAEYVEHLREMKRQRPDEYRRELERGLLERADFERAKLEDPERYRQFMSERELDRRCFELARRVRESDEGKAREDLTRELERAVGELFDLRESWRRQEIEMLERELARLREEGEQRRRHRGVIVQRRIEELTGQASLYAW